MFVDKADVNLQAGDGGDGITSFRRERYISRGGPDGGDGGDGGNIIFIADTGENTLADFRHNKLLKAPSGSPGGRRKRRGKRGLDLVVKLPLGTMIVSKDGELVADLNSNHQQEVIVHGGKGGFGNAHFTSSVRQAPRFSEKGEPGQRLEATLELKMIADVGLVGLPNAGKSTLLSVISNARPEIADYPFTTLRPNLGVVDIDGAASLLFADIPGLIEGASQGKGLGDEFLRHIERTSLLVHLIDIYADDEVDNYKTIMNELKAYTKEVGRKPQIVALTKTEGFDPKLLSAKISRLKKTAPRGTPVIAISSAAHQGLNDLVHLAAQKIEKIRKNQKEELPLITLSETPQDTWEINTAGENFVVTGPQIERFAQRTRFGEAEAEQRLMDILRRQGILKKLDKLGIKRGQEITIGSPEIGRIEY